MSYAPQGMWTSRLSENERQLRKQSQVSLAKSRAQQSSDSEGIIHQSDIPKKRHSGNMSTFKGDEISPIQKVVGLTEKSIWTTRLSQDQSEMSLSKSRGGGGEFQVLQKLLQPAMTFGIHRQILDSDDHAFNSEECDLV